jgi:2-keto-4-pentenoate hydratase
LALPFAALTLASAASAAFGFEAEKEADAFYEAWRNEEPFQISQIETADKTEENAYKIQAALFKKIFAETSDSVNGYKAGLTTDAQLARFKAPGPVSAPLLNSGLIEVANPQEPFSLKMFPGIMLETEFAFKTAASISSSVKDVEELKKWIQSIHAAVEVPQVYFVDMPNLGFFDLTASGVGSKRFVIGPAHETELDVDSMRVILKRDGAVINEGKGSDVLGGQWKALLWLVNNVVARGERIEAGQYLMTGALGGMLPGKPGKYVLTYPFETLTFEVID